LIPKRLNHFFDKLAKPNISILHRTLSSYQFFGYFGLTIAVILSMTLVTLNGLSHWVIVGIAITAVLTFFSLAMVTKIITGEEQLIYYHHEIAVMLMSTILLWLLRQPILPYLDIAILGIGIFLSCGRVGCLMVGCCHGRPHKWGVCYRKEHAEAGFTHYYVGIRLFPIQIVESIWVLFLVIVGTVLVMTGAHPGEVIAWYVIAYDIGRFLLEFVRGDPERPYYAGFSEAQWTSIFLMIIIIMAEIKGALTFHWWHVVSTVGLILLMIAVALKRRFQKTPKYLLLNPRHIEEVAEALDRLLHVEFERSSIHEKNSTPADIKMECTSQDVQISTSIIKNQSDQIYHYALSRKKARLTDESAEILAELLFQLKKSFHSYKLIKGNKGVFHLLINV
jgi:prolipoprotein diacylglyceryltransferase